MLYNDQLKEIKSRKWFLGARRDESLLFYSMKAAGERKYLPTLGLSYVGRLLVPNKKGFSVRALDEGQAGALHGVMRTKILKNPKILSALVKKDRVLLDKLVKTSAQLQKNYPENTVAQNVKLFEQAYDLYALHSAYVYTCFAGGVQLAKNFSSIKNAAAAKKALADHDQWRNFITFPEEEFGKNIFAYLRDALQDLKIKPARDFNFLTIAELIDYLQTHSGAGLLQKIKSRKQELVFLELEEHSQIITAKPFIKKIKDLLLQIDKKPRAKYLTGQTAFGTGKISGEIARILDIKKFSGNLKGKIVLAVQTTPYFLPYLGGVKAIITDEGGITCHAAIISREMKIHCIVGTQHSTKMLKNGDFVELDLDNGTIRKQ